MNKKAILAILTVAMLTFAVAGFALPLIVQYWHPNEGTIGTPSLEMYLKDNTEVGNFLYADTDPIQWGLCDAGVTYYFENMTVVNTGNIELTVHIVTENLPTDWVLTWAGNDTLLAPDGKIEGQLELTIPAGATEWGEWGFYLTGEQP